MHSPTTERTAPEGPNGQRSHRGLGLTMIVAASVLAFFAIFAIWANRQALNTDNWTDTSSKLLENRAVRSAVSTYLVDQLYANVNVSDEIRSALPPRAAPLAGPAAGALREFALRVSNRALQTPRVQAAWENSNRLAHRQLLDVLNGRGGAVSTGNGVVKLDLTTLLSQTEQQVGVGGRVAKKLPPGAAQITILRSNQLKFAQDAADALKALAIILPAVAIGIFALAIYLARGWRREALRATGIGLTLAGLGAIVARTLAGDAVVNSLATTESVRPAAEATWSIGTSLLTQAAVATLSYGIVVVFAAWLAGPTRLAVSVRSWLAPFLREARFAYGALALIVLLLLVWGPTPASRQAVTALFLIGLLVLGWEMLRRQTAREYPDASLAGSGGAAREGLVSFGRRMRGGSGQAEARPPAADARLEQLERLVRLRDAGALDDVEFRREKQQLLAGEGEAKPTP